MGKKVAIKVLPKDVDIDEDRLARFSREGRMLAELKSLKHPNIAEIYEQAEYDGKPCIVLEYVPGDTLADRLRNGPAPIPEALQIALQIADALQSAHQRRIVHRDLKPANIKITPEGQVKVLDFGLAKRFQADLADAETGDLRTRSISLTESGMLIGTPAYMSPEQWNGQEIDQRTDLWAFGCVLYEMLTGRPAFSGKTRAETMKAVLDASPNWQALPSGAPLIIQNLLLRCFHRDANQRLQNAKDARRMIAEAITENRFALLLFLKTWFWKIGRRTKVALAVAAVIVAVALLMKYTSLKYLILPNQGFVLQEESDLAVILPQKIKGMTPDLVRAALMPNKQSSDDLLQGEQGRALRESLENKEAVEEIIKGLKSKIEEGGETAQLLAILAQAYLFKFYLTEDANDKNSALQAVRKALSLNAESPDVLVAQGNALISIGELEDATRIFEGARLRHPDEPEILLGLAIAYDFSGDEGDLAEGLYKAAIDARQLREGRPYWGDVNDLGWFYFERGWYQRAADCWREVVRLNPLNPTGYINLGNALLYLGCFDAAVKQYLDSISSGGETIEAHTNLGATYFYLGRYADSINHLRFVTSGDKAHEDVNLIEAWLNLGDSLSQMGQQDEARNAYGAGLKLVDHRLMRLHSDIEIMALKAEFIAKMNSLGENAGQDDPVNLIEKTLDSRFNCLECVAAAVTVYHLAGRDDIAAQTAERAVAEGYSPILLTNNPQLASLKTRPEFRRIQQVAQTVQGKCGEK